MKISFATLLEEFGELETDSDRIELLRRHDGPVLRKVLNLAFNPEIQFREIPDFEWRSDPVRLGIGSPLSAVLRRSYLYTVGGNNALQTEDMVRCLKLDLESLDLDESKIYLSIIKKKFAYPHLTPKLVNAALGMGLPKPAPERG